MRNVFIMFISLFTIIVICFSFLLPNTALADIYLDPDVQDGCIVLVNFYAPFLKTEEVGNCVRWAVTQLDEPTLRVIEGGLSRKTVQEIATEYGADVSKSFQKAKEVVKISYDTKDAIITLLGKVAQWCSAYKNNAIVNPEELRQKDNFIDYSPCENLLWSVEKTLKGTHTAPAAYERVDFSGCNPFPPDTHYQHVVVRFFINPWGSDYYGKLEYFDGLYWRELAKNQNVVLYYHNPANIDLRMVGVYAINCDVTVKIDCFNGTPSYIPTYIDESLQFNENFKNALTNASSDVLLSSNPAIFYDVGTAQVINPYPDVDVETAIERALKKLFVPETSLKEALQEVKDVAISKAPFSWFQAWKDAANINYGDQPLTFSWQPGLIPDKLTITVPVQKALRTMSTIILSCLAIWAGYMEVRRFVG